MTPALDRDYVVAALGPSVARLFLEAAERLPLDDANTLAEAIRVHVRRVRAELSDFENVDVALAERIAAACLALLDRYSSADPRGQAAIVGASRYFLRLQDAADDIDSAQGYLDDAKVVNFAIALSKLDVAPVP